MPRTEKQQKLGDFYASLPIKIAKPKAKKPKADDGLTVINIDGSDDEWDAKHSKLAPSSQITSATHQEDNDSDASNGPVEMSPVTKRQRRLAAATAVSDIETSGSDDHIPLNRLGKRKMGEVGLEDERKSPAKKRKTLRKGLKPLDNEENLMDELDPRVIVDTRLRTPAKKMSVHAKALERMKRKRLGLPAKASSESDASQEGSEESDAEGIEADVGTKVKLIPGARPATQQTESSSEADTNDFVVEDEGDVGEAVQLPIQFSMNQAQPLALSFKVFFQFLVHIACQPAHLREVHMTARLEGDNPTAEYWRNAVNQLRRTLGSIRDSQVASTIWSAEFRNTLETFPELHIQIIELEPYCHACRRKAALSTRQATLGGEAYNKLGFEPLEESSGDDSDDEEEDSSASSGAAAPTTFNLGQHCARRAALFHAMYHWEYTLFKAIETEIAGLETQNRDKLQKKKKLEGLVDTDDPDSILDLLDRRRMVDMQWKVIDNMMERAKKVEVRQPGDID